MNKSLFEYKDYKSYLTDWIRAKPRRGHGERFKIAKALQCHPAYVSQVLNGDPDFSLEQAELINRHLGHGEAEAEYFILLVEFARAGTSFLKNHFSKLLLRMVEKNLNLKNRLQLERGPSVENQAIYYSSWIYGAIHVALSIPGLRKKDALAEHLGLSIKQVTVALKFLLETGIAVFEHGEYRLGTTNIHLDQNSPLISKHHTNWRMQAIHSLEQPTDRDFHYSSVATLSRDDATQVRRILVQAIERVRNVIKDSREDEVVCYALDFFPVGKARE